MPENPRENPPGEITQWLHKWEGGDPQAFNELIALVQTELQQLAHLYLKRERRYHSLQTDALVNEVYVRLATADRLVCHNHKHFFVIAARAMRRVLTENARRHQTQKRGDGVIFVTLSEAQSKAVIQFAEVLALDDALNDLERLDPLQGQIVELRYFAGLTIPEVAEQLGLTVSKVKEEWRLARAWLHDELQPPENNLIEAIAKEGAVYEAS